MLPFQTIATMHFILMRCASQNANKIVRTLSPSIFSSSLYMDRSLSISAKKDDSSLDTRRLPLGNIFQNGSRDYLFSTSKNIRDYEWTVDEAEELFESISSLDDNSDPLELGAITVMEALMSEDLLKKIGKNSKFLDVHDGQQRLISLCLLLAAIRDNMEKWPDCSEEAIEVAGTIYPKKIRLDPVLRINVREKHAKSLRLILSKVDPNGEVVSDLLGKKSPLMPMKMWKNLPQCEQRVLEVYRYFLERIKDLGEEKTLDLKDRFEAQVYLLVCIPSDTKMARNIVMGQGKGKNIEPVDSFKGLVCFNSIQDENTQDKILHQWNKLSDEVGRNVLQEACLLVAQGELGKALRKNCEVDIFEEYLDKSMGKKNADGKHFFENKVEPAAKTLKEFYDGSIQLVGKDEKTPSLSFLQSATNIATAKEVKIVVLDFLLKHKELGKLHDVLGQSTIEDQLKQLECIALWSMLTKPKPKVRFEKCINILSSKHGLVLSTEENEAILEILNTAEFGAKPGEIKKVKSILQRLNEYCLLSHHQNRMEPVLQSMLHLEHILPQNHAGVESWTINWTPKESSEWLHRLGNLVLLNQKKNATIGNSSFKVKAQHFSSSPYPLTNQISKHAEWNLSSLTENHNAIIELATKVFCLF
mmetsp:Transcript_3999/g.8863  ORF Transcript_3999/g.8863 Transcript_3999/m.8863 type:complete len:644 (+) Transcript_3999:154-2085(+)